ncbi:MAG: beta strand repeat-containing protein, partial [Planctomycetota bacterium]
INTGATVGAALQVNTGGNNTVGLIVRGNGTSQSANLLAVQSWNGTASSDVLTVANSGATTIAGATQINNTLGVLNLLNSKGGVRTPTVNGTTTLGLTADAGTLSLTAGGANAITASTNGAERLRITSLGDVGIGSIFSASAPTARLDVDGSVRARTTLLVDGATTLGGATTLRPTGTTPGSTNELRFAELVANGSNYVGFKAPDNIATNRIWTLPSDDGVGGTVLSTNGSGVLSWITPLTASSGWALTGNLGTSSGGALGAAPTGNYIGTNETATPVDLRFATGGLVRAIITGGGQFQTNNVAIGGGTINNTVIGGTTAAAGTFTTVTTPIVTNTGALAVTAGGTLSLAATGANVITASTDGTERLRITSGGLVGLNTGATVGAALQVNTGGNNTVGLIVRGNGTSQSANLLAIQSWNGSAPTDVLTVANSGATTIAGATQINNTLGVQNLLTASGGVRTPTVNGTTTLGLTADAGTLSLTAGGANAITASTNGAERLRINSLGEIGIGTDAPTARLDVNGTLRVRDAAALNSTLTVSGVSTLNGATTVNNTLRATGATTLESTLNVTGATTIGGATQINNTLGVQNLLTASGGVRTSTVSSGSGALSLTATSGTLALAAGGANPITLATNGAERMRIDSAGRVGIGTNDPSSAQLMVLNNDPFLPGVLVRGALGQQDELFEVQSNAGVPMFSIGFDLLDATEGPAGSTRIENNLIARGSARFQSIAGGTVGTTMGDNDRIVVANSAGMISQVSPDAFVDLYAWGLQGNANTLSSGDLGTTVAGGVNFVGTTDQRSLRLATNNTIRAILNWDSGRFDVGTLRASEVSSAGALILRGGSSTEGLRITGGTSPGRVGIGGVTLPDAQLQVNTSLGTTVGVIVNGRPDQTANLLEARNNNVAQFVVTRTGAVTAGSMQIADIGTGDPNTATPSGYDRVVISNNAGQL